MAVKIIALENTVHADNSNKHKSEMSQLEHRSKNVESPTLAVSEQQSLETSIRSVIKEELFNYFVDNPVSTKQKNPEHVTQKGNYAQQQNYFDNANQRLQQFIGAGAISNMDMGVFYSDVDKLDKTQQTKMLRELAQAINSGQIKLTP